MSKTIFIVHVNTNYWRYNYKDWDAFTKEQKKDKMEEIYHEFEDVLKNAEEKVVIVCPFFHDTPTVKIDVVTTDFSEKPEIIFIDKFKAAE